MAFGKKNTESPVPDFPEEDEDLFDLIVELEDGETGGADEETTESPAEAEVTEEEINEEETAPEEGEIPEAETPEYEPELDADPGEEENDGLYFGDPEDGEPEEDAAEDVPEEAVEPEETLPEETVDAEEADEEAGYTEEAEYTEEMVVFEEEGESEEEVPEYFKYEEEETGADIDPNFFDEPPVYDKPREETARSLFNESYDAVSETDMDYPWDARGELRITSDDDDFEDADGTQNQRNGKEIPETDKVKAEKLEDLMHQRGTRRADYAAEKLSGLLGITKESDTKYDSIAGMKLSVWAMIVLAVYFIDVVLLNVIVYKAIYRLVEGIMKVVGSESLKLDTAGSQTLYTIISCAIAFIFGGLLILALGKVTEALLKQLGTKNSSALISKSLLALMVLFVFIGLIVMIATRSGPLSLVAYRWIGPFLAYAGGLVFFTLSNIGKNKAKKQ